MADNNGDLVKLQVSDELIRGIVTKQVQAAMLTAMGGREEFFEKIVTAVMTMKVDANGNASNYGRDYQWLDVMIRQMIQKAAQEAITTWIKTNHSVLEKAIEKGFQGQTKNMASAFANGILKAIDSAWQFKVDVNFNSVNRS